MASNAFEQGEFLARYLMGEVEKKKEFGTNSIEMDDFGPQLRLLKANDQIRELQTTIRNK